MELQSKGGAPISAGSDIFLQIGSKTSLDYTNAYRNNLSWLASPGAGRSAVLAVGHDGTKRALAVVGGAGGKSASGTGDIFNTPGLGGGCNDTSPHAGQLIAAGYEDSKGHLTESGKDFIYRVQACVGCNQYENFAVLVGGEGAVSMKRTPLVDSILVLRVVPTHLILFGLPCMAVVAREADTTPNGIGMKTHRLVTEKRLMVMPGQPVVVAADIFVAVLATALLEREEGLIH